MNDRKTDWIQTFTGKRFWPLEPRVEDVDVRDIAHALSLVCRFSGHCSEHYSVAQHSVLVVAEVEGWLKKHLPNEPPNAGKKTLRAALLHDAAEAYLADVVRPVKQHLIGYKEAEDRISGVVAQKYDVSYPWPPPIAWADNVLLATERRDLMAAGLQWELSQKPSERQITPWRPQYAERVFLQVFEGLTA